MDTMEIETTCPLCGEMFKTRIPRGLQGGDSVDMECPACGDDFSLEVEESDGATA